MRRAIHAIAVRLPLNSAASGRLILDSYDLVDASSYLTCLSFLCMRDVAKPTRYRIHVRGVLGQTVLTAFPDLQPEILPGETVLVGALLDQAALYGVLGQIEALGLELLEVRREAT